MSRLSRFILVGSVSLALVVAGVLTWRATNRPEDAARAVAQRIAAALAQGRVDPTGFVAPVEEAQQSLDAQLKGMGSLRPIVTVGPAAVAPDGASASVRLGYDWTIHAGKPAWRYDAYLTMRPGPDGWRAVWESALLHPQLTAALRLRAVRLAPERGEIVGANGQRLVWNQQANRLGLDKTLVDDQTAADSARALAKAVGIDPDAFAKRVAAAGSKAFVEAIVLRRNEEPDRAITRAALTIVGARALPTVRPLPASPGLAAPLLGRVGEATAEVIEASAGRIRPGDLVGLSGLQASRDQVLTGVTGFRVVAYEAANPVVETELFRVDPVAGTPVATTLDLRLQRLAEKVLAPVKPAGALVVVRPSDGAILAAASGPGGKGYSTALRSQAAPGSVFKTVTVLGALRAGLSATAQVTCTPAITVAGKRFDNWQGYPASSLGKVPLATAFAHSCNTAMIRLADTVSQADLAAAADALGLTAQPSLGVSSFLGSVPEEADVVGHAASMIGQGEVLASPLGMATVAASIGAGRTVTPWLVGAAPAPGPALDTKPLRSLMREVTVRGSGKLLSGVPGKPVLSKTGTASYGSPVRFHAWMIALQGDLAVAVYVDDGVSGAVTAGPLMKQFLTSASRR